MSDRFIETEEVDKIKIKKETEEMVKINYSTKINRYTKKEK